MEKVRKQYLDEINRLTSLGIAQGLENSNNNWKVMALNSVVRVAKIRDKFTVDAVRAVVEKSAIKTHDNRAMGGIMKLAQKIGIISPTGNSIPSKVGHKVPMQIWKSNIFTNKNI